MICQECMVPMKPLFTGFFCPNDCDRPHLRVAKSDWSEILTKMAGCHHDFFRERARLYAGRPWFIWLDQHSDWHAYRAIDAGEIRMASLVVSIDKEGLAAVTKSRDGVKSISQVPDYTD